ncbi:hypothetical protein BIW11_01869 [Tropilaelaps mercedesae]|uniref:BTB domain-containing protein n=1 Tax=Tropilaelaps mercedesae TaxID=418985 RepID=A0A1V9X6W3_9ACAR|nr:hypothetical protein BIW11_01869 [Tropilaelaps mercedesae]
MYSIRLTNRKIAVGDRLLQVASDTDGLFPSDFHIVAGKDGGRRAVHSFVLADASDYFRTLVNNSEFVESRRREAELPVDSETLKLMLDWVYTRNEMVMSVDQAVPLYIAAQQFLLDDLSRPLKEFLLEDVAILSFLGSEVFLNFTQLDIMSLADVLLAEEMRPFRPNVLKHLHRWVTHDPSRRMDSIFKVYDELARGDEAESNIYLFGPWSVESMDSSEVLCYRFANDRLEEHTLSAPNPRLAIWYGHLPDNLCFMQDGHITVLDSSKVKVIDSSSGRIIRELATPLDYGDRGDVGLAHFQQYLFLWIGLEIFVLEDDGAFTGIAMSREKIRRMFVRRYKPGLLDFIMQAEVKLNESEQPIYGTNPIIESLRDQWSVVEQGSLDLQLLGVCGDKAIIYRAGEVLVKTGTDLLGSIPVPLLKNGYSIAYSNGQVLIAGPATVEVIDLQTFNRRSIPFLGPRFANRLRVETITVLPGDADTDSARRTFKMLPKGVKRGNEANLNL